MLYFVVGLYSFTFASLSGNGILGSTGFLIAITTTGGNMNRKGRKYLFIAGLVLFLVTARVGTSSGAPFAYIPNHGSNSVLVVDQQTNKITTTVPVGTTPRGVAVNPAGTRVYITNFDDDTVSVINGTTQAIIGSPIPVGNVPRGVIVSPSGSTVYVANEGAGTISVIDAMTNTVTYTINDIRCNSLAIDPSGRRLYAGSFASDELLVIDTATWTVVGTPFALPGNTYNIAINPTGSHLYVATDTTSVYAIRTTDNTMTEIPVGSGTHGIAVHPSGAFVYAVDYSSNLVVIDAGTNTVVSSISLDTNGNSVSFNTDGSRAFVPQGGTANIRVIDTATHTVIDAITAGGNFGNIYSSSFIAPHRHVWNGTTSFPIKLTGIDDNGKFVKDNETITGKVVELRTLGSKYSLLFLSDDLKSSIFLPDVTFLMTDVDGSKSEKALLGGVGKYYFHDGSSMISGIAHFDGSATLKIDGPGGNFISATLKGTIAGGKLQEQHFTGKVRARLGAVQ